VPDRSLPGIITQWNPIVSELTLQFLRPKRWRRGAAKRERHSHEARRRIVLCDNQRTRLRSCWHRHEHVVRLHRPVPGDSALFSIPAAGIVANSSGADAGSLPIRQSDEHITAVATADHRPWCASWPHLGDAVLVLGHPRAAGEFTLTATEGIVSEVAADRYLTSAPIENGKLGRHSNRCAE
jgi:hypothetical protein